MDQEFKPEQIVPDSGVYRITIPCTNMPHWVLELGSGYRIGVGLLQEGGLEALSGSLVIAGGLADLLVGGRHAAAWNALARWP
jgi:hypothetical protein